MLYIPEMLRHTLMPGQDFNLDEPERKYNIGLVTVYEHRLQENLQIMLYIPEMLRHTLTDARTSTWMNQKGYITLA